MHRVVLATKASISEICQNLPNRLPCHRACVMGISLVCFILEMLIYFYLVFQMYGVYWQKVRNVPAILGT